MIINIIDTHNRLDRERWIDALISGKDEDSDRIYEQWGMSHNHFLYLVHPLECV